LDASVSDNPVTSSLEVLVSFSISGLFFGSLLCGGSQCSSFRFGSFSCGFFLFSGLLFGSFSCGLFLFSGLLFDSSP
jgi:hypothetical protein